MPREELLRESITAATDDRTDTRGQQLAERDGATLERELLDEILHQPSVDLAHRGQRQGGHSVGQPAPAGAGVTQQVADCVPPFVPDQYRQHQRAAALVVIGGMPYTSATASTNTDVASRKTTVSPATAASAATVPMPGKAVPSPLRPHLP